MIYSIIQLEIDQPRPLGSRMRSNRLLCAAMERWDIIAGLVGESSSVLDVGCRDQQLKSYLPSGTAYVGLDLFPPADIIASAEEPLPFRDREFSCVVLADVLEHLNDPHSAFREAMRVGESVVLLLPNLFSLYHRLRYLAGKMGTDKYEFGPENPVDRHRWLMNYVQARDFTRRLAETSGCRVVHESGLRRMGSATSRIAYSLARAGGANLWAWEYVARVEHV